MKNKYAFSIIEILITMVFLSLAFLPLYNLFQFGQKGTKNNLQEVAATNYASDLVNYIRELKFNQFEEAAGSIENFRLSNDSQIAAFFRRFDDVPPPPPPCEEPYTRIVEVRKFKGKDSRGPLGIVGWVSDLINKRRAVPNFLITVRVEFPRPKDKTDQVSLYTIVMD
jgi:hypothetical protein